MPNVNEGLETLDPNSDVGFHEALARQSGGELSQEAREALQNEDTSVSSGLQESAPSQSRDDKGRFVPAAQESDEGQEGEAPAEGERAGEEGPDPDFSAFLERHGGNAEAALAAALKEKNEAQSVIGRQGNDLGQERQARQELVERLARLEGRLEAQQPQTPAASPPPPRENIERAIEDNGGAAVAMWTARNDPDNMDNVLKVWAEVDPEGPFSALSFRQDWIDFQREAAKGQKQEAEEKPDAFVENLRRERQMADSMGVVRKAMPESEWNAIKDYLAPLLGSEDISDSLKEDVLFGEPDKQIKGIKTLVRLAKSEAYTDAVNQASQKREQDLVAVKQAAQVATGSQRPVDKRQPSSGTPMGTKEITEQFHKMLLDTETTSVADGLTYANR